MLPRRKLLSIALAVLALVMSGCEVRQGVEFDEDGSGTFTYLVGVDKEVLDDLGVNDPYESVKQQVEEGNFPVELERYDTADLRGFRLSFEFSSVDDLKEKLNVGEKGQEGQQTIQVMNLERGDERWTLTGEVGAPNLAGAGADLPIDVSELQKQLDMEFTIAMPGKFADSNADSVRRGDDSTTFVWELAPGVSGRELLAETDVSSASAAVSLVLVAVGIAVLLILAAIWMLIRRRRPVAAEPAAVPQN